MTLPTPETPAGAALIVAALAPYITGPRLMRMRSVLSQRTRYLTALLEELYDPHNVAACARTADGLGLQDLHVVPHPPPREGARAPRDPARTMGDRGDEHGVLEAAVSGKAERWLDLHEHPTIEGAIRDLQARGHRVVAAALDERSRPLVSLPLDRPLVLVFGNERAGVSEAATRLSDDLVVFPMRGFAQSFNVSVAFSLMMGQLRTRLEAEVDHRRWSLPPEEQTAVLARWLMTTVPHAREILAANRGGAPHERLP